VFANPVDEETLNKITHYIVNPVEARVKDLSVLVDDQDVEVKDVPVLEGFTKMSHLLGLRTLIKYLNEYVLFVCCSKASNIALHCLLFDHIDLAKIHMPISG